MGNHAIAAVHDHPDLDLVGVLVYGDDKAGRDAGDIAGIGEIGVSATTDVDEIIALDADCVLYMSEGEWNPLAALDDVCRLLSAGKNVVSTAVAAWIHPESVGDEVAERLEAACDEGRSSFHGTGIQPGWVADVLPLTMSGQFRHIDTVTVQQFKDYVTYEDSFVLFDVMGFGKSPLDRVPMDDPTTGAQCFKAPLMLLAEGLGATIDDYLWDRKVAVADQPIDIAAGRIEAGMVAAMRFSYTAIIEGRCALKVEQIARLGADRAPHWPSGRGWKVSVEGVPSMVLESRISVHDEDDAGQGGLGPAMHAVHAIAPVCAAKPGICTLLDLPTVVGRGVLSKGPVR